ncbi:hypothetical protein ES702_03647 [subsurface metagenome]
MLNQLIIYMICWQNLLKEGVSNSMEHKYRLPKDILEKLHEELYLKHTSKSRISFEDLAKKLNISPLTVNRHSLFVKCQIEKEKIIEGYESRIKNLKKAFSDKDRQEDTILNTLYCICIDERDTNACIAWLRATGKMKLAEIRAKEYNGEEMPTWEEVVKNLWEKKEKKEEEE